MVAVYIPLRTALAEVTWQIRVRGEIQSVLDALPHESVESSVKIERHRVSIRMVTVGRPDEAAELKKTLEARVERVAGVKPTVQVIAVPDAEALRRLESTLTAPPRAAATALPQADVSLLRTQTADALRESWPTDAAGALRRWELGVGSDAGVVVDVSHFGPPLGAAGQVLLGRSLSVALGSRVTVRDRSLSEAPILAPSAAGVSWLPQAQAVVDAVRDEPDLFVCIETPVDAKGKTPRDAEEISRAIRTSPAFADPRISIADGEGGSVHLSQTACTLRAPTQAQTRRPRGTPATRESATGADNRVDVADLVATYGLPVVVLGAMVEGESIVIAAGYLAHRHHLPIWSVAACAAAGGMMGDQGLFLLGRRFGDGIFRRLLRRLSRNVGRARDAVERHPRRVLLSMRFLYGMRIALPLLCGASRMRISRFVTYNVATAIVWAVLFAGIGYEFGAVATAVFKDIQHYEWILLLGLVLVAFIIHRISVWLRGRLTDGAKRDGS